MRTNQSNVNIRENHTIIDSLLHPLALPIRQLLTRSGRQELNQMLIDDEENIVQALDAGIDVRSVYFSGDEVISDVLRKKLPTGIPVYEVAKRTCKKLFQNDRFSRIFAIAQNPKLATLGTLTKNTRDIVVLENISISGNIGAIIRTSLALNVGGIVLLNADPVDIYDRRIIRASRGYVFSLPVVTAATDDFLQFCKDRDINLLVATVNADMLTRELASFRDRLFIVFGSEKMGCSRAIMHAATHRVKIPINPRVESLNVSAAAGIMLYNRIPFNSATSWIDEGFISDGEER